MTVMRDEIGEIPAVVRRLLGDESAERADVAAAIRRARPRWASIVARGTSDHAGIYGRFLVETQLGLPTGLASPSVTTIYHAPLDWRDGLVLAISQSGQSPDIVAVTEAARAGGATTVAITNAPGSPLAQSAEFRLDCRAGEERAVAATKTYVAELAAIAALVAELAPDSPVATSLPGVPDVLAHALDDAVAWVDGPEGQALVASITTAGRVIVASRGFNLATALEISLKLKETSGVFAEGYSTADLEHGPIVLATADVPTLVIRPDGPTGNAIDGALGRAAAAGSAVWRIGGPELSGRPRTCVLDGTTASRMEPLGIEALTPLWYVLPGQLVSEAVARRLGRNPDAPIGLKKVTLTR
jgi:glucosamine--fructose-6-phosphate aminotransferase (isomerizing)